MNSLTKRLLLFATISLTSVGCDTPVTEQRLTNTRGSTWELAIFTTKVNERVNAEHAKLLAKRIGNEALDAAEIRRENEEIATLERYVKRFETHIGTCRKAIEELKFDRKRNAEAFEDIERAERALPKVQKRLALLKDTWSECQHGKPLPPKI